MASQHHNPPQGATKSTPTLIFHTSRISKVYTVDLSLVALVAQMPVCSVYSTSYWIFLKHPAFCPKSGLSARYAYFGWFGIFGPDFGLELRFCEENRPPWNWADDLNKNDFWDLDFITDFWAHVHFCRSSRKPISFGNHSTNVMATSFTVMVHDWPLRSVQGDGMGNLQKSQDLVDICAKIG